ncbi:receptor-like cytosolic serine/threonine-protein kinase RBK2 isoform X2 [Syzygium oleosum]|uniref:receptor-like cytosolic serine/threonine-protein kinase RBK2 isoform X2 n=1 Tax=Syzygium oleosum TaxID=219896 RepID=UPI0024B9FA1F|nr:receptor-like cytosolic serine/threonine-protein kinase RBK2 isoform X2 [Syzygium oleosum]
MAEVAARMAPPTFFFSGYSRHRDVDYGRRPVKILIDPVKQKKRHAALASSASAQDLRLLDMEKEKLDESSPRGVIEACIRSLEPEAEPPKEKSEEQETHCSNSRALSHWIKFFTLWKRKSIKRLASFPPLAVPKLSKRKSRSITENITPVLSDIYNFKSSLVHFTFSELQMATNYFSHENLIGKGGYAEVYKGCLKNGQLVAVKRLNKGTADERIASFLSELGTIAHVNHPNIAKLIGCGVEGGMHIVFQLSALGSLGSVLHGSKANLGWDKRYKIALGTADGLLYLHESCQRRIIHRDIKADNILLAEDFEPQICDFGLAKWLPKQWTHHNVSKFEGTFGYFAPEYFMHGIVDEKTDVYAFGVLLLELITGQKALDHLGRSVVLWAKPLLDDNVIEDLIDPSLGDDYNSDEMDRVIMTASLCIEQSPILRPRMNQASLFPETRVAILLRGESFISECTEEGQRRSLQRTYSEELLDAQEYNSTRYLSDLKHHKEVALSS